jgi:PBP1b-binding outer membrane lipoprotein LpoB
MPKNIILLAIILFSLLLTGCAQKPAKQNDYFQTLENSKKSLDKLKDINSETKMKAEEYEKNANQ